MNRIEKAVGSLAAEQVPRGSCGLPALAQGHDSPRRWEPGMGAPEPGHPAPVGLPFICWLCHFLSTLTLFLFSVISNNVTASLESIHQSRKQPVLTLIKKNAICASGESSQPHLWRHPRSPPPACHFKGCPGVIRFRRGRGALPQVAPPLPLTLPSGETALKGLNLGGFLSAEEPDVAVFPFSNGFLSIG